MYSKQASGTGSEAFLLWVAGLFDSVTCTLLSPHSRPSITLPPQVKQKQPWYVHAKSEGAEAGSEPLLWVAGLFDSVTCSFTLLTADAPPNLQWLHDRVPVLLDEVRPSFSGLSFTRFCSHSRSLY